MSKTHTPGPWRLEPLPQQRGGQRRGYDIVGETPVVILCNDWRNPHTDADAALISAAPDLLAALLFLVREARASGIIEQEPCMVQARAAIAKAGGSL